MNQTLPVIVAFGTPLLLWLALAIAIRRATTPIKMTPIKFGAVILFNAAWVASWIILFGLIKKGHNVLLYGGLTESSALFVLIYVQVRSKFKVRHGLE
jgi:hypothetical protein